MKNKDLIICPVYNEKDTLSEFYDRLRDCYSGDVLFVDDGSTDSSGEFLENAKCDNTFVIRHRERAGYGAALKSGFRVSLEGAYTRIITMDADLQHAPEMVSAFLNGLLDAELILGSRYVKIGSSLDVPRDRLLINRYIAELIRLLFSVEFSDPFGGYRGYRDTFLKKIRLEEKGYGLALEILLEAIRTGTAFRELSVEAIYFDHMRTFLDGLDRPQARLLYYLDIIGRKRMEMKDEKKVFDSKPSS